MTRTTSPSTGTSSTSLENTERDALAGAMRDAVTNGGKSLRELTDARPQLVVFLRHAGCPFCREAASDLSARRKTIEARGVGLVLVHQNTEPEAKEFFAMYGLEDVPRISDPERALYRAFDLKRGSLWQIFGPKVWWRSIVALVGGHRAGRVAGDAFQMPGAFLIDSGVIVSAHRHRSQADRPDYDELATCPRR